jgi:hypothetical protein
MHRASAPRYDRFKLMVTAVLAAILLLMLLRGCATNPTVAAPETGTPNSSLAGAEMGLSSVTAETSTPSPATATSAPTATFTEIVPTPTSPASTPTQTLPAEETTQGQATPTAAEAACNTSAPSRLAIGQRARVLQRLNMRSDALINAPILQTNPTGTQVEIIGGPVCTPVGERAYLWWQIRLPSGAEGWSAESQLNERSYLLEPIQ